MFQAPSKEALLQAVAVASNSAAADYLYERLTIILNKVKIEASEIVLAKIDEFRQNVHMERDNRADPWLGKPDSIKTDFQKAQENHGTFALKQASEQLINGNIKMDIAISDLSQLLRAFSIDNQPVSPELASVLDRLFNAWLAEQDVASKDSVIYAADANGKIKKDSNSNAIKADVERIKQLISDKNNGFSRYLQDKFKQYLPDKNLTASVQQHEYPVQRVEPTTPAAPEAPKTGTTDAPTPTVTAAPAPEAEGPEGNVPTTTTNA